MVTLLDMLDQQDPEKRRKMAWEKALQDLGTAGHPMSISPLGILYRTYRDGPAALGQMWETIKTPGDIAAGKKPATVEDAAKFALDVGLLGLTGTAPKGALRANIGRNQRAFHVSPRADVDFKFSEARVGSGEGGAAFGWGANLTDNPAAVKWYKDNLGGRVFNTELPPGKYLEWNAPIGDAALAQKFGYTGKPVVKWGETGSGRLVVDMGGSARVLGKISKDGNAYIVTHRGKEIGVFGSKERAQAALETIGEPNIDLGVMTGQDLYMGLEKRLGSKKAASKALSEMGIKGMKVPADYAGSTAKNTHDYVIFSPEGLEMKGVE